MCTMGMNGIAFEARYAKYYVSERERGREGGRGRRGNGGQQVGGIYS